MGGVPLSDPACFPVESDIQCGSLRGFPACMSAFLNLELQIHTSNFKREIVSPGRVARWHISRIEVRRIAVYLSLMANRISDQIGWL